MAGHFLLLDGPSVVRLWLRLSLWLMPYVLRLAPWLWRFSGTNFAVRANAFAAVGGFKTDMGFGEDADLCQRLRRLGRVVFEPRLVVKTSGRAFLRDRLGLKYFLNYLSLLVRGKALLAIRHRADLKEQGVMAPKVRQMPRIAVRGSPALATLTKYQAAPPGFIGVRPTLGGIL